MKGCGDLALFRRSGGIKRPAASPRAASVGGSLAVRLRRSACLGSFLWLLLLGYWEVAAGMGDGEKPAAGQAAAVEVRQASAAAGTERESSQMRWSIAIHGGAGSDPAKWDVDTQSARLASLESCLRLGMERLERGDAALDVVEQVVMALEDDPLFNAGRGAVLDERGGARLDAAIMEGASKRAGAVAGVERVKHPIQLARQVMQQTSHVLVSGAAADQLAGALGLEQVEPEYFVTEKQRASWQQWQQRDAAPAQVRPNRADSSANVSVDDPLFYLGTVGCVVRDQHGRLAAGTSTGGLLGKRYGRIGDSPIIGAGTYADDASCAVSCTGIGELFIREVVAHAVAARMKLAGETLADSADHLIEQVLPVNSGGLIAVDAAGNIAMPFNTPGMSRAAADSSGWLEVKL
jgi:L-asparaginase / beta-aspartyl-peptidase